MPSAIETLIVRLLRVELDVERLRAQEARDLLLPMGAGSATTFGLTTNTTNLFGIVLPRTPIFINRFQAVVRVHTTNDGGNYWNLILTTAVGGAGIAQANTSALAPSSTVFSKITGSVGTSLVSPEVGLYVFAARVGSPGNLDILAVSVNAA